MLKDIKEDFDNQLREKCESGPKCKVDIKLIPDHKLAKYLHEFEEYEERKKRIKDKKKYESKESNKSKEISGHKSSAKNGSNPFNGTVDKRRDILEDVTIMKDSLKGCPQTSATPDYHMVAKNRLA